MITVGNCYGHVGMAVINMYVIVSFLIYFGNSEISYRTRWAKGQLRSYRNTIEKVKHVFTVKKTLFIEDFSNAPLITIANRHEN